VVDEHGGASVDVADDLHVSHDAGTAPPLVDHGETCVETFREGARPLHTARVRRDDRHLAVAEAIPKVLQQDGRGVDVVDGNVEEALDLPGMQVDRQDSLRAGGRDQIGDQLGTDGYARGDLSVLPRV